MSIAARSVRRGAIAMSGAHSTPTTPQSYDWNFGSGAVTTIPAGSVQVKMVSSSQGDMYIQSPGSGGYLIENNGTSTTSTQYGAMVFPASLATNITKISFTNAFTVTSDRGNGTGLFSANGTRGVFFIICGNTSAATIHTWDGTSRVQRASLAGLYSTSASDVIDMRNTISGGIVTWTVYKNNSATSLTWTDSSNLFDIPGRYPAATFKHTYSGGHFKSPGIKRVTAADI